MSLNCSADPNTQTRLVFSLFCCCLNRGGESFKKREEQEKQAAVAAAAAAAAADGRLQIYHLGFEWKEVLLVVRAAFHFTLIQCEVFKT